MPGDAPVRFDPGPIAAMRHGAAVSGFTTRDITSDAAYVSRVAPRP
jgi:hypothetical protein